MDGSTSASARETTPAKASSAIPVTVHYYENQWGMYYFLRRNHPKADTSFRKRLADLACAECNQNINAFSHFI
jgi:hypothetical protein